MTRTMIKMETVEEIINAEYNSAEPYDVWQYTADEAFYYLPIDEQCALGFISQARAEELKWEKETSEWLLEHSNVPSSPYYSAIYSDVHKALYGFRPHCECYSKYEYQQMGW